MVQGVIVAGWIMMTSSGILLGVQSGVNLTLGHHMGKSAASVISFCTGLACLLVFFLLDTAALKHPLPTLEGAKAAPWWAWFGGPMGAFYVASVIIFAPKLGAANSFAAFVSAQLTTALLLDSFGIVGYKKRAFHWARGLGIVLLIVGVMLITQFDGNKAALDVVPPISTVKIELADIVSSNASQTTDASSAGTFNTNDLPHGNDRMRSLKSFAWLRDSVTGKNAISKWQMLRTHSHRAPVGV